MALLQITASDATPRLFGASQPLPSALRSALKAKTGPVTLMVHGYKYASGAGAHCPHKGLYALQPDVPNPRVISWPRHLKTEGVCLGFGWPARGALRDVYARAAKAGHDLASVITLLRRIDPKRPIHILCHSMGGRVALCALPHLPAQSVRSLVILAGAEYRSVAQDALQSEAGQSARVWHVTSGENDLYDFLFERFIPAPRSGDHAMGTSALPGLTPIVLDDDTTLARLAALGHRISPPARRVCHWSPYLRGGVFGLYSALIREDLCPDLLQRSLPQPQRRRWSRVLARLPRSAPLPIGQDASV